ncbi:MAG: C69 family dipeptidase [bacterium]|nr:C69 family dipeptidase [bacterium]
MNEQKKHQVRGFFLFWLCVTVLFPPLAEGCTMVLAGKNAAADGSVLLAHNNDLPGNIGALMRIVPAQSHDPGEKISFKNGLQIPQVGNTFRMLIMYCYYGFAEGDAVAVNEHGVAIAGGTALRGDRNQRAVEADPLVKTGISGYIRYIALQRAKTARECVEIMGEMFSRYGISYPSGCGVADADEVWYIEIGGGKCWAAQRVPDDCYMAAANGYRLGVIDFNDKKNFIYPSYLKKFAAEKNLWKRGTPFDFAEIFGGRKEKENDYYNARRVWRIQRLLTPSLQQSPDGFRHRVMLKADQELTVPVLTAVLRDYYTDTPFDVSRFRSRPAKKRERAIGVFNTVHTDVIQLRDNMPPEIGAVMWAGMSCALTTPYIPYYLGIKEIPSPYGTAGPRFDDESAFWHFRNLATLLELRFPVLNKIILPVWSAMETDLFSLQESIEKTALELYKKDKEAALDFLTSYSNGLSLKALETAKTLKEKIETQLAETSNK